MDKHFTVKEFFSNILNGIGVGIVIALIPNAILGVLFSYLSQFHPLLEMFNQTLLLMQFAMSFIIGIVVAHQFKFQATDAVMIGAAGLIGSGAVKIQNGQFIFVSIGDVVNLIVVLIISCYLMIKLKGKFGSLDMLIMPIIISVVSGFIGMLTLPYVSNVTKGIGKLIEQFSTLNPLMMCILIAITYALLMVTPISVVAIATAVGLNGLSSGAGNMGIVAACVTFLMGSWKVNDKGINIVLIIGAAKMMIPVYFKNPIIAVPLIINGLMSGLLTYFVGIKGTPMSTGFGYTGFVGPANALKFMEGSVFLNILILGVAYFVIPFVFAYIVHKVCLKILPKYNQEMFLFKENN
ncbi:PTS sugar transporter subunit IIC [Mammaliicoccus sciuri]|uniref:PTS transporter subunit IIC n=1 Tax=Mammaliicoccus sciuri TaxID=1296 RepID=UPI001FB21648|nr:PTS sugar transporter subunit IIC [Mammaliicoccus sciuri]MCJ0908081.1 PTS sugar transporter subunit IIC [Mammaliicoccus sciuri]